MKIHKGDQILIIRGKDKGKKGKVLKGFPKESLVLVEGVNIKKKSQKPKKEGQKGQIIEVPSPVPASCLKIICPKCKNPVKIGYKEKLKTDSFSEKQKIKVRICKKCGEEI